LSITIKASNQGNIYTAVSSQSMLSQQTQIIVTNYSSTDIDFSLTKSGIEITVIVKGSFDFSSFTTPPKTLADLISSNASLLLSSLTTYANGELGTITASTSPLSLSAWIYSDSSLAILNSLYSGNDAFYSSTNNIVTDYSDEVYGYAGNDTYYDNHLLTTYHDTFYGGTGLDTAVLPGKYTNYTITAGSVWDNINKNTNLSGFTITDNTKTYNTLQINQVERVQFSDAILAVDFSQGQSGYDSAMMIAAAFGKSYVNAYFSAGLSLYDQGQTNLQVATIIVNAGLIESQIGSTSNTAWLDFVYKNVTGVAPDKLTEAVFVTDLNTGVYTKASLLALAAGVSNLEQQIGLTGLQQTGLLYHSFI